MSLPPPPPPMAPAGDRTAAPSCYRHPGRDAGRRCTRCGNWACAECLVQVDIGSHCVDCAKAGRPDARTRARYWSARQPAIVTYTLIAINVLAFIYSVATRPRGFAAGSTDALVKYGLWKPALQFDDEWYRLVTSGFMHVGFIHLAFNMYMLFQLGQMIEPSLGRVRFILLYLASLLGGSALALVLSNESTLTAGASGAVFGLMGFAAVGYWLRGVNPLSTQLGSVLMLNLVLTFMIRGISIGGHIGGAIAGALCGLALARPRHRQLPVWAATAAPFVVMALSVAVSVAAAA